MQLRKKRLLKTFGKTQSHAVRAVESVDGATAVNERCGRGVPLAGKNQGKALVLKQFATEKMAVRRRDATNCAFEEA
ncbi:MULTISPECIES: hypothetical protein [unclassified Pseudomonas]|uniref:hypothetical protein n=1 Tax=unclassified Pseudomonas TaxID=196821 RepID=UPI0015AFCB12|nr:MULTISPECIES: hypothetical protein [unclassified Pseudomonas]